MRTSRSSPLGSVSKRRSHISSGVRKNENIAPGKTNSLRRDNWLDSRHRHRQLKTLNSSGIPRALPPLVSKVPRNKGLGGKYRVRKEKDGNIHGSPLMRIHIQSVRASLAT